MEHSLVLLLEDLLIVKLIEGFASMSLNWASKIQYLVLVDCLKALRSFLNLLMLVILKLGYLVSLIVVDSVQPFD